MKYIVFQRKLGSDMHQEIPVLFPECLTHSEFAKAVTAEGSELHGAVVVSAGFVSSMCLSAQCHGESTSLGIGSRGKKDDLLIQSMDYFHGVVG